MTMIKFTLSLVTAMILGSVAMAAPDWKLSPLMQAAPDTVAASIRESLASSGYAVNDASGVTLMEFWFRKEISTKATEDQLKNGLTYRELPETSILAVVRFPKAFTDFRKQEIAAGTYTLRLAFQPETGDHMGTAPHTEFALLSPIAADQTLDTLEPKNLVKQSLASTGGDHPGVMLLFPNRDKAGDAKLVSKGDGIWTLNFHLPVTSPDGKASLGFALTVAGISKTR